MRSSLTAPAESRRSLRAVPSRYRASGSSGAFCSAFLSWINAALESPLARYSFADLTSVSGESPPQAASSTTQRPAANQTFVRVFSQIRFIWASLWSGGGAPGTSFESEPVNEVVERGPADTEKVSSLG